MNRPIPSGVHADLRLAGFGGAELLAVIAVVSVLAAVAVPMVTSARARTRLAQCEANLKQVTRAVLMYAEEQKGTLPLLENAPNPGGWWYYKDQVKGQIGLTGESSPADKVFACPSDRGYGEGTDEPVPFWSSKRHNYTSYVFNGVNLPGIPNVAGRTLSSIAAPARTLAVMEWTAHAPLSWHKSLTRGRNAPFYDNAESVVGFVDGHVKLIPIYYDGMNPAYTRDPIAGYDYTYSGQ